jgi:hypothetical protein
MSRSMKSQLPKSTLTADNLLELCSVLEESQSFTSPPDSEHQHSPTSDYRIHTFFQTVQLLGIGSFGMCCDLPVMDSIYAFQAMCSVGFTYCRVTELQSKLKCLGEHQTKYVFFLMKRKYIRFFVDIQPSRILNGLVWMAARTYSF